MATAPNIVDEATEETPVRGGKLDVMQIMQADNLMDLLSDDQIAKIGRDCLEQFDLDLASRDQKGADGKSSPESWEQRYDRYLDIAMQVRKAKSFPWPGAANIKVPLLTTASIQFQARSYPVIVDGANLVKGRVLGQDPDGSKRERADRVGDHLTWQLLYDMPGWEEDTDRLLLMLPIVGCVFRKTYYDSIRRKNVSKMVSAKDFVINYWAASIEEAPRFTQIMRFYPYEIEERFRSGLWSEVNLPTVTSERDQSDTAPTEFLEQHCRLDLDKDGYPEPYVVTLVRENGEVVRIVPCFDMDGVTIDKQPHGVKVVRIDPKRYFTKYGFIPAPDGSFYDIGFGALLDDITAAIDTTINQMLDAGTLQNAQGGFIGNGVNIRSGDLRFRSPGEWKRVDVTGGTLASNIVPLQLPGPSQVLFNLLQFLIGQAKEITSVQDILTGAGQGLNTPATTVLAQIEQATKVMTAIFKRIHRSFGQELRILFGLNKDFMPDEATFPKTHNGGPPLDAEPGMSPAASDADVAVQIGKADYEDTDIDVVPVSDPTMINDAIKAVRSQALSQFINDPMINQVELRRRILEGQGQPDIEALMKVPAPAPDPKLLIEGAKLALEKMKFDAAYDKDKAAAATQFMTSATDAFALGLMSDAALFAGAAMKLAQESSRYTLDDPNGQSPDGSGNDGGMAQPSPDQGIPPIPGGPSAGGDGSMGPGPDAGDDAAQFTGGDDGAGNAPAPVQ